MCNYDLSLNCLLSNVGWMERREGPRSRALFLLLSVQCRQLGRVGRAGHSIHTTQSNWWSGQLEKRLEEQEVTNGRCVSCRSLLSVAVIKTAPPSVPHLFFFLFFFFSFLITKPHPSTTTNFHSLFFTLFLTKKTTFPQPLTDSPSL